MSQYDAYRQYPELMSKLDDLERDITGGTTATVALICNSKLYVANVGMCCRCIVYKNNFKQYFYVDLCLY